MTTLSLIAALDESNGIGFNNKLLCHLPADLQHFKNLSLGKPIIMGRSTFESIGKPLPNRLNIVLSRKVSEIPNVLVFSSLDKALASLGEPPEIMIIGGAQLFEKTIGMADRLYITRIHHQFKADVFFPSIDEKQWFCQSKHFRARDEKNVYDMSFYIYEKSIKVK